MSARDDYQLGLEKDFERMCDEIDRLRAEVDDDTEFVGVKFPDHGTLEWVDFDGIHHTATWTDVDPDGADKTP